MITKAKFSNSLNDLKCVCLGSTICIVSIAGKGPVLHLYTGCRLDQNFSKSIIDFQKVKVLNY